MDSDRHEADVESHVHTLAVVRDRAQRSGQRPPITTTPTFTVIIPTRGERVRGLRRTLGSVIPQLGDGDLILLLKG